LVKVKLFLFDLNQSFNSIFCRERGVEIEFPSDRKKKEYVSDHTISKMCSVVKIPYENSLPYEEITLPLPSDNSFSTDPFLGALRIYFQQGYANIKDLKKMASNNLYASEGLQVNEQTLADLASQGGAEAFTLSNSSEQNAFQKVSLYLDEIGQVKKLTLNQRASELARTCGFEDVPILGDAFVCRLGQHGEALDFHLSGKVTMQPINSTQTLKFLFE
jgi:hypothetical protein